MQTLENSREPVQKFDPRLRTRLLVGILFAILLHLLLLLLSKHVYLPTDVKPPLELVNIDEKNLKELKEQILKQNRQMSPLLSQEVREEYKSKQPPKNAKFIGKVNQEVPEETVAGAQNDAPQVAQSQTNEQKRAQQERAEQKSQREQRSPVRPLRKNINLSDLGFKNFKFESKPQTKQERQAASQRGPNQMFRPVGRDAPGVKRGPDNLLNAVESEYYSFFSRFEEPLIRNWYFFSRNNELKIRQEIAALGANPGDELPCIISFTIDREGNFESINLMQSSKVPSFDQAALMATRKLGSLRNPPEGIFEGRSTFTYQMSFTLVVTSGMGINAPSVSWP